MLKRALWSLLGVFVGLLGLGLVLLIRATDNPDYEDISRQALRGFDITSEDASYWTVDALNDRIVFSLAAWLGKCSDFFRSGVESKSFESHLASVRFLPNPSPQEGLYNVEATTAEGIMYPGLSIYHWYGATAPTLIYNHGASQYPFDALFRSIFDADSLEEPLPVNLIVIRAPFHREGASELPRKAATLSRFMAALAVTVQMNEAVVQWARSQGSTRIAIVGLSMGGFIANRHHLHFNSADYYIPVLAGTRFSDVFLNTSPAHPDALRADKLAVLDFEAEWRLSRHENVFPVLGRSDQISRLSIQGPSYGPTNVEIWDKGHISTATSVRALRHIFLRHLIPDATYL